MAPPGIEIGGPLLLFGCGKMGGALLSGWLEQGVAPDQVTLVEPVEAAAAGFVARGVRRVAEASELDPGLAPAVVLLAVKPQQMDPVMARCAVLAGSGAGSGAGPGAGPGTVFLSIAAGKTLGYFASHLGDQAAIVRVMPNTPAAVGRGMSVLVANRQVSEAQKRICGDLLSAVGGIDWVADEGLLDAVTAVSGGGPAYVFLLIEALAQAGVEAGLPEDLAMRLARGTVAGSGELVRQSDSPASTLRENVTSPGGTTLEALNILMAPDGLQPLMTRAIAAATERSRELAS